MREALLRLPGFGISFSGRFEDWHQAAEKAEGYDSEQLLQKLTANSLLARDTQSVERDGSVLQELESQPPFTLLSALNLTCSIASRHLSVLDIGGALGTHYRSCRPFLAHASSVSWRVVEQQGLVESGRQNFQNDELGFYPSIETTVRCGDMPNFALMSAVLQYLPHPWKTLEDVAHLAPQVVMIDRLPVDHSGNNWATVQKVPSPISSSYASWVFERASIFAPLTQRGYRLWAKFNAIDGVLGFGKKRISYIGAIFYRNA